MSSIQKLQSADQIPANGVVFWWSNILRSYQMRVYKESAEVVALRELHVTRAAVEAVAQKLATAMNLEVFEIEIEQLELHTLSIDTPPAQS